MRPMVSQRSITSLHVIPEDRSRESRSNETPSDTELAYMPPTEIQPKTKKKKKSTMIVTQYDQHGTAVRVKKVKIDELGNPIKKEKEKKKKAKKDSPTSVADMKHRSIPPDSSNNIKPNYNSNRPLTNVEDNYGANSDSYESLSGLPPSGDSISTIGNMSAGEAVRQNRARMAQPPWIQQPRPQLSGPPLRSNQNQQEQHPLNQHGYYPTMNMPQHSIQGSNPSAHNNDKGDKFDIFALDFDGYRPRSGQGANVDKLRMLSDSFQVSALQFSEQYEVENFAIPPVFPQGQHAAQQGNTQQKQSLQIPPSLASVDVDTHSLMIQYMISTGADPSTAEQMVCQFEDAQRRGMESYALPDVGTSAPTATKQRSHDIDKFSMFAGQDEDSVSSAIARALAHAVARAENEQNEQVVAPPVTHRSAIQKTRAHHAAAANMFGMPMAPPTPEEKPLNTRALLIQYMISVGTDPDIAEQMADEFNDQQESDSGGDGATPPFHNNHPAAHHGIISAQQQQQLGAIESFHHKHMEAMNGGYRQQQSAPIGGATVGRGPMSHSMPVRRGDGRPVWHRADQPGAVEMEGRAFGAPRRMESTARQSESFRNNHRNRHHEELDVEANMADRGYIEAVPVTDKDLFRTENIVYAESSAFGLKHMLNERPVRRLLALICIIVVCVTVGATVTALRGPRALGALKNADINPPSSMPTQSPSSFPTSIDNNIENAAAAISGYEIVLTEGSPQRQAVSWMSTWDKFDTQGLELIFFQRYIMTVFYFALNGEQWLDQEKWLSPTLHTCDWSFGIICSTDQTRRQIVTGIDLSRNGIRGNIPSEISQMDGLTTLRLAKNTINGTIPTTLSDLTTLTLIDLSTNELTGSVPSGIGNLQDLLFLDLYENSFTGSIPSSMYHLSLLKKLDLSKNRLTGFLSQNLTNLGSLSTLNLQHNQLKGQVPEFIGLDKLESIYLDYNDFTGTLPNLGRELVGRLEFTISHNRISGGIPGIETINVSDFVGLNYKIQKVDISFNQITGSIPALIALIPTIRYVDVSSNRFTGLLPAHVNIYGWKSLEYFGAASNQFTGAIPVGFSESLTSLDISSNHLTEGVPFELYKKFPRLKFLSLSNNNLEGNLSGLIGKLGALRDLRISNCSLTGILPDNLKDASNLEYLTLDNNNLKGAVPTSIGMLTLLKGLTLQNNNLTGTLPSELGSISLLKVLNVANNSLTGALPSTLLSLDVLIEFDFSGNSFSGDVPQRLCDSLEVNTTVVGCE